MNVKIRRSEVDGKIIAPPSKSYTHRALICSALAPGVSGIHAPLISDDTESTRRLLGEVGAEISGDQAQWLVKGGELRKPRSELFCAESGTTLRFMAAVCALLEGESTLTAGPALSRRPNGPLLDGLRQLGVNSVSVDGFLPITIRGVGRIRGGEAALRGDISSQFVSALLFVAPLADEGVSMRLTTPLESKPYVSMTMHTQREYGVDVHASDDMREFHVEKQVYSPADFAVEGDWSSASYLLAAGALAGRLSVEGLNEGSLQSDASIVEIIGKMGAHMIHSGSQISAEMSRLSAVDVDLSDCPDLFPVVATLCAVAKGRSILKGVGRLRYKESDRADAMIDGLRAMGIEAKSQGDGVAIVGGAPRGCIIDPRNDHRNAMAFAILGLVAEGETTILNAECVSKSYPDFWNAMRSSGMRLRRTEGEQ
jgi:3-phosphoshikimate 1-carboxyvinyltransferase